MRVMKLALLGSAALAAVSVSARADDLSDLKAQINALNARVASMEATPAVPAGYSLASFSKGQDIYVPGYYEANKNNGAAHVISIIPSADAPSAASAVITWSGWVRGAVVTGRNVNTTNPTVSTAGVASQSSQVSIASQASAAGPPVVNSQASQASVASVASVASGASSTTSQYFTDIRVRGEVVVSGKTDTAVGEVGARLALETAGGTTDSGFQFNGGNGGAVTTDGFWGWWKMTPNLTLGAGVDGSLAKNSKSFDAACTCYYESTGGTIFSNNPNGGGTDPAQIRLSYNDGPIGIAIAVEDSNNNTVNGTDGSSFGVAGKALWSTDMFSADLSGGYWGNTTANGSAAWAVDGGLGVNLGSMASIMATAGYGSDFKGVTYTRASGMARLTIADMAHAEIGATRQFGGTGSMVDATVVGGGLYYDPVKQLTVGAEGSYQFGGTADGSYVADLVTVFRF